MPYYSDEVINEVFSSVDIVDIVSQYVQLKRNGRDYSGLCPFHAEKSPSFHVSPDKQLFHCFGCGASGNAAQFIMRAEHLDFVEALKSMAERAGIELPEENRGNAFYEKKQRFLEMNKTAAKFFYDSLTKNPKSEIARKYFAKRNISPKTITVYGLGYADEAWDSLLEFLKSKGYSENEICDNSLAVSRDGKIYDKFRSRVMFPIIDLRGHVIGFGGRIIRDDTPKNGFKPPKYLNSSETICFSKGNNLFSLNLAKNAQTESMILSEGYMDVISVYQAGVHNTVATLGTALTENQAKLLMKYCREILICYDSDDAGTAATKRAIDIINSVGGRAKVINLGDVKDPDEFIKKYGSGAFANAVKNAVPSTEYNINRIALKYDTNDTEDKIRFINEAAASLASVKDEIEVDAYVKNISDKTDISREAIYSAIKRNNGKKSQFPKKTADITPKTGYADNKTNAVNTKITDAEKLLLSVICKNKRMSRFAEKHIPPEQYSVPLTQKLAEMIYSSWNNKKQPDPAVMAVHFDSSEADAASAVFYNMQVFDNEEITAKELIKTILTEQIQIKINKENDPYIINELIKEKNRLGEEF